MFQTSWSHSVPRPDGTSDPSAEFCLYKRLYMDQETSKRSPTQLQLPPLEPQRFLRMTSITKSSLLPDKAAFWSFCSSPELTTSNVQVDEGSRWWDLHENQPVTLSLAFSNTEPWPQTWRSFSFILTFSWKQTFCRQKDQIICNQLRFWGFC